MEPLVCGAAADAIESMQNRVSELEAARIAYASEFQPDAEGLPDTGNIHANIRAMKARVAALQSRLEVTENAPDGIACRDMTIEMLEKRIKELEDERAEREKQRPVAWLDKSTEKRPGDTVWLPDDLKGMDTSWLFPLYAASTVTSDIVNKAFADGKAEGHGDATAEASVVIGELRARVAELEAWRNAVLDELVSLNIACQEPALYVQTDHFAQARTAPFLARVFQQPIEGVATLPFYAAPPVTAPVRITDEQVEHALRTNCAYESDAAYAMAKDGLLTDARAVETAVLRANGFKVDNQ